QLGPLVGKRTWGGLVGISNMPPLMDGGQVTSPDVGFFSPAVEWDVEHHGVDPDVPVDQEPKAMAAGHDPQLDAAVALALRKLGGAMSDVGGAMIPNRARPRGQAVPVVRRIAAHDLIGALKKGVADVGATRDDVLFIGLIYPLAGLVLARLAFSYDLLPLGFP